MHDSRENQSAFDNCVLRSEEEVSGINSGLADFLQCMSMAEGKPLFVSVNVGERIGGAQPICGQLWVQEDRQTTAMNGCFADLGNSQGKVALSGIVDAFTWRHALETSFDPDYKRPGQSVIVYPKFLDKLGLVVATGNIGMDRCDSRWPVYEAILKQSMSRQMLVAVAGARPQFVPVDGGCQTNCDGELSPGLGRWSRNLLLGK
jgi:hypothetical protein